MTLNVDWIVSDNQRETIAPAFNRALAVAPHWMRDVTIRYDPSFDGGSLNINVQEEYRMASIRVADAYFAATEEDKRSHPVHEVMHMYIAALASAYDQLLKATTEEDSPARKMGEETWRRAEEGCVSDLTIMVDGLLPPLAT